MANRFIEEVKAAISGRWFNSSNRKKHKTAEDICLEELNSIHEVYKSQLNKKKSRGEYNEKHDAFFDKEKDIWLEEKCNNPNCEFCKDRLTKPSACKT